MIAKQVAMNSQLKSNFSRLARYITDSQDLQQRIGDVRITNCHSNNLEDAALEIEATQASNVRAKSDKTCHLVVSFPAGEEPEQKTLKAIEDKICESLGYGDHQRISAVHNDTDNLHIHIAINKIHPQKRTLHDAFQSHRTLGEVCEQLEKEHGLEQTNHIAKKTKSQNKAQDLERHTGIESLVSWVRRECAEGMKAVKTWKELHKLLEQQGLAINERGSGLILQAKDGLSVKCSTISREFSKPSLVKRLGAYEGYSDKINNSVPAKEYKAEPLKTRQDTSQLYARYKTEQEQNYKERTDRLSFLKSEKERRVAAVKRNNSIRRSAIKLMGGSRAEKKVLYKQASASLKSDLNAIYEKDKKEKAKEYSKYQKQRWADWLRSKAENGDREALSALRARQKKQTQWDGRAVSPGKEIHTPPERGERGELTGQKVTKQGTVIHEGEGRQSIREKDGRLHLSGPTGDEGIKKALEIAARKYGQHLSISGDSEFKERVVTAAIGMATPITFADASMERRRQELLAMPKGSNSQTKREVDHERARPGRKSDRRSNDRSAIGPDGRAYTRGRRAGPARAGAGPARAGAGPARAGAGGVQRGTAANPKPNIGRVGQEPPPSARHRMRALPELGMVRIANRSEMLLQSDVRNNMEQQRTPGANSLRWPDAWAGLNLTPEQKSAGGKYVEERNDKRSKGFDIMEHKRYNDIEGEYKFAGVRSSKGCKLALLQKDKEILVLPIDDSTARRLKNIKVGHMIETELGGKIRTGKGKRI